MTLLNRLQALNLIVPTNSSDDEYSSINLTCKNNILTMTASDSTNEVETSIAINSDHDFSCAIKAESLLTVIKALDKQKVTDKIIYSYDDKTNNLLLKVKDGYFELFTSEKYSSIDKEFNKSHTLKIFSEQINALIDASKFAGKISNYGYHHLFTYVNLRVNRNIVTVTASNGYVYYSVNTEINYDFNHELSINIPVSAINILKKLDGIEVIDLICVIDEYENIDRLIIDTGITKLYTKTNVDNYPQLPIQQEQITWGTFNRKQLIKDIEKLIDKKETRNAFITINDTQVIGKLGYTLHKASLQVNGNIVISYTHLLLVLKAIKDETISINVCNKTITINNSFIVAIKENNLTITEAIETSNIEAEVMNNQVAENNNEIKEDDLTNTYGKVVNKKSINHICFDDSDEYFILNDYVYKSHRSNTIDLDTNYRCGATSYGSPESILSYNEFSINRDTVHGYPSELIKYLKDNYDVKQDSQDNDLITETETIETSNIEVETMNKQVEDNNIEIENTITEVTQDINTKYVVGVGDIELISVDKIQTGMYLSYADILYKVKSIETVNFINASSQTIITVRNLINASIEQKILVSSNELLQAWFTSYEKAELVNEVKEVKTEVTKVAKREIKPIVAQDENIQLPKPKIPSKSDAGIKGEGREKLLKMVASGCTLQDMMTEFNWSEKNAQNHVTYIKWWGYNLKREGKVYKLA